MEHSIEARRVSGWYTTILPTLIFLSVVGLFVYGVHVSFDLGNRELSPFEEIGFAFVNLIGGTLFGVLVIIPAQKLLLRFARRKTTNLAMFENEIFSQIGTFDLSDSHSAQIRSGVSPNGTIMTEVTIHQEQWIHISIEGISRLDALRYFPVEPFVLDKALSTEYGIPGYELQERNTEHIKLMTDLLTILHRNRQQNFRFQIHSRFPWLEKKHSSISFVREVHEHDESLSSLRESASIEATHFALCHDQIIVTTDIDLDVQTTFLLPLGYCSAEIVEQHFTAPTTTGVAVKQRSRFIVSGRDQEGNNIHVVVAIMPNDPSDEDYITLQTLGRFINYMT